MINFRFHLVSLVAVFLALALGVVMGSTVIDRAIVDQLRDQIETVRHNADARYKENQELNGKLAVMRGYAEETVPYLVGRRLEGVAVAMVGVRGVNGDAVRAAAQLLRQAGADLPGMIWIEPAVTDPAAEAKLGQALGDAVRRGPDLQRAAMEAVGQRLATGAPPGLTPDLLTVLMDAGFLTADPLGGRAMDITRWPQAGSRMLIVDGNEDKLEAEVASVPLVRTLVAAAVPVALAEMFRADDTLEPRGGVVGPVRRDRGLSDKVATVDDLEEARGRAVLALAVEGLGRGVAGHYGEGPGATRQLPDLSEVRP